MICADYADIPLSQLENPKTAESAMETLGRSVEELVLEHNLQGLLIQVLLVPANNCSLPCYVSRATTSLRSVSPWQRLTEGSAPASETLLFREQTVSYCQGYQQWAVRVGKNH